jgi:plastocyanin
VALGLLAAACAADEGPGGAVPAAGADGGGTSAPTVEMNNFSYTPATIRVASGSAITVRNGNAATPHTFTVQGTHIDVEEPPLASTVVTIDLPPGRYRFSCRFHAAQDMEGTLIVT